MHKAETFWHRLALASEILRFANSLRNSKSIGSKKTNNFEEPIFRTQYAAMIWDIVKEHKSIRKVCLIALHDAEDFKFDMASSIDGSKVSDEQSRLSNVGDFTRLKRTKLLKHIYHVVFFSLDYEDKIGANMPALLLVSLLHDFGKHKMVISNHRSATWTDHEEISANYARHIMKLSGDFNDEFIESVCAVIATHHKIKKPGVPLRDYLNKADMQARYFEGNYQG